MHSTTPPCKNHAGHECRFTLKARTPLPADETVARAMKRCPSATDALRTIAGRGHKTSNP